MPALKAILAKVDEVEEKYRDLYTQQGDKWVFTGVEGIKTQADIDRLNTSLTKERTDHKATKDLLKVATDKAAAWDELEPDAVKVQLEELSTLKAAGAPDVTKNFQAMVQTEVAKVVDGRIKSETNTLRRQLDEANKKLGDQTTLVTQFTEKDNRRTISDAVQAAAVAAKVLPEALPDVLLVAGQELKLVDGKVLTEDGRDPIQVIEDFKAKRPYFWPTAQGAGGRGGDTLPGGGGPNPFSRKNHNVTSISQLVQSNPTQAAKLAEQAGVPKNPDGSFKWHVMPEKADA